jgi:preprotein translocase subunit SecF
LYFFGGEVISALSLPILVGIVIGAYSSVVIAVPLLALLPFSPVKKKEGIIDADTGH